MIFTSYFAKTKRFPENVIPIAICAKAPEWYKGLQYKKLAPKYGFFMKWKENHDNDYYTRHYYSEVLEPLGNPKHVIAELYKSLDSFPESKCLPWESEDFHIALVCYERPDDFCHRHIVAEWLRTEGYHVQEWEETIMDESREIKENKESKKEGCVISVTGHRPKKMYGYDMSDYRYLSLKNKMKKHLVDRQCTVAVSGMALGVDQLFAEAVIELKEEGNPIKLHCAIPCKNHPCKWNAYSQKHYEAILSKADEIVLVSDAAYQPYLMQVRNEYMVNMADEILAIWDGSGGGTGSCVGYAKKKDKKITIIEP